MLARIGICFKIGTEGSFGVAAQRKDVLCVLPTRFDKSLIYQMFVHAKSSSSSVQRPTVNVTFSCNVLSRWAQLVTVFSRMFKFSQIVIYRAKSLRRGLE